MGFRTISTKSLMKDKIDFQALGLTKEEKKAAVGYFETEYSVYLLSFKKGTESHTYAYDVRNGEWYPWDIHTNSIVRHNDVLFFANDGHLRKFDKGLYSDWDDKDKTIRIPMMFERYSPIYALEFSGFPSYWDYYLLEARMFYEPSTLDVITIFFDQTVEKPSAIKNEAMIWGKSKWGEAKWVNPGYSDIVNQPNEIIFHNKSKYVQMIWRNDLDEPVEIYKEVWKGRLSGR